MLSKINHLTNFRITSVLRIIRIIRLVRIVKLYKNMVAAKKILNDAKEKRDKELQENLKLLKEKENEKAERRNLVSKVKRSKTKKKSTKKGFGVYVKRPSDHDLRVEIEIFNKERVESK